MNNGYTKARLVPISHETLRTGGWKTRKHSEKNIKGTLKDAGYTDKEITKLNKEGRILIRTKFLSTTLKAGQKLYVLEIPEDYNNDVDIDRFKAIELD